MKKIVLLLTILMLCVNCALAANNTDVNKNAFRNMARSHQMLHDTCINISRNFRSDNRFSNYFRNRCLLFESDRQRLLDSVFPITNNGEDWYKEQYPALKANYAITMDKRELENYRLIVNEYCKYNMYKFTKKDPQICSKERLDSLFYTIP